MSPRFISLVLLFAFLFSFRSFTSPALVAWPTDTSVNVPVAQSRDTEVYHQIAPDGLGGVFVVWSDFRTKTDIFAYAQHLDEDGNVLWAAGAAIRTYTCNGSMATATQTSRPAVWPCVRQSMIKRI